jgi:hypothetical protein
MFLSEKYQLNIPYLEMLFTSHFQMRLLGGKECGLGSSVKQWATYQTYTVPKPAGSTPGD